MNGTPETAKYFRDRKTSNLVENLNAEQHFLKKLPRPAKTYNQGEWQQYKSSSSLPVTFKDSKEFVLCASSGQRPSQMLSWNLFLNI
ncbi:hypothetical protein D5086_027917 [Populus alba]|uniref:Uncharacterized protein n=1 Tax=Populus alba TaxID=43335 RepID=A0ACC4AWR2_POPAL